MGYYKFKFSDMMPSSWFYKLIDITKTSKQNHQQSSSSTNGITKQNNIIIGRSFQEKQSRESHLFESPRRSSNRRRHRRKTVYRPSRKIVSCGTSNNKSQVVRESFNSPPRESLLSDSDFDADSDSYARREVEIDIDDEFDTILEIESPVEQEQVYNMRSTRKLKSMKKIRPDFVRIIDKECVHEAKQPNSPSGIKLRVKSPKIKRNSTRDNTRKGISESFAVVMSSSDPRNDFKDSMVEMIVENEIKDSKDLEYLLSCYLSLNSNEYHDLIVKSFEEICLDSRIIALLDFQK